MLIPKHNKFWNKCLNVNPSCINICYETKISAVFIIGLDNAMLLLGIVLIIVCISSYQFRAKKQEEKETRVKKIRNEHIKSKFALMLYCGDF